MRARTSAGVIAAWVRAGIGIVLLRDAQAGMMKSKTQGSGFTPRDPIRFESGKCRNKGLKNATAGISRLTFSYITNYCHALT